jgi:hypothetical protein
MSIFYVYELWNPLKNKIFYVGKGTGNRIVRHERYNPALENPQKAKDRIIRKIQDAGLEVIKKIIFETEIEDEAFAKERELIKIYGRKDLGLGPLTNLTDGGEGGDTWTGMLPEKRQARIDKWHNTFDSKTEEELKNISYKKSVGLKQEWENNREARMRGVKKSMQTRDRVTHAKAVSEGWHNRPEEEKQKTAEKRRMIRKTLEANEEFQEKMNKCRQAAHEATSEPILAITPTGQEIYSKSISEFCRLYGTYNFTADHRAVSSRLNRNIRTWPRSRWYGWKFFRLDEFGNPINIT